MIELKIGAVFCNNYPPSVCVWCNNNNAHLEEIPARQWHPRRFRIVANGSPSIEQIKKMYENAVQEHLNKVAQERGYDNTYTCMSYLNSTNEVWKREANAFNVWRDSVWTKCHEILNAVMSGQIEQPSVDEVISQMPIIEW
jgi:hypothetical protein